MPSVWWFPPQTILALNRCTLPAPSHLIVYTQWLGKDFLPSGSSTKSPNTWCWPIASNSFFIPVSHVSVSGDLVAALQGFGSIPSSWSWLLEIAAAPWMGVISSNSSSSIANCADSTNISFPTRFRRLPSAGGFHSSPSHDWRPANSRDFFFDFGGSGDESKSNGSCVWLPVSYFSIGCEVSDCLVGVGSKMTSR